MRIETLAQSRETLRSGINTLRKIEDIPADQRKIIEEQFFNAPSAMSMTTPASITERVADAPSGCPYHKG